MLEQLKEYIFRAKSPAIALQYVKQLYEAKMATPPHREQMLERFAETKTAITVQRNNLYGADPPDLKPIKECFRKFLPNGRVTKLSS